jgi:hypothetical protein
MRAVAMMMHRPYRKESRKALAAAFFALSAERRKVSC